MSVPVQDPINQAVMIGGETLIPWTWNLQTEDEITILVQRASTKLIDTLTLGIDYTVDANGLDNNNGGNITPIGSEFPVTIGDIWTLFRVTAIDRSPNFATSGAFFALTINEQLDELTRIAQDVNRDSMEAVRKDPGVGDALNPLIPQPADERALKFRDTGGGNFEMVMSEFDPDMQASAAADSAAAALASEQAAAISEGNADADAVQTAADRVQTGLDEANTDADAVQTAADRVQTGLDAAAALASEQAAGISETNASNSETAAGVSEVNAANSAAGVNLPSIQGGDAGKRLEVNVAEDGYDLVDPPGATAFRGALVAKTANQTISNLTGTVLTWDAEDYDTDAIHDNVTNNSRLTVPAGVVFVQLAASAFWNFGVTGWREIIISKNGTGSFEGQSQDVMVVGSSSNAVSHFVTPVLAVVGGDYFEVSVTHNNGGNLAVNHNFQTFFSMDIKQ